MVKVMYNDQLLYNVVIWAFFGISLWTEKVALRLDIKISCKLHERSSKWHHNDATMTSQ